MISTIFFDFGGVFTYSPFTTIDELGQSRGAQPGQYTQIMFGSYHDDGEHPWHQLERGEISIEDARQGILELGRQQDMEIDLYEVFGALPRDGGVRHALVDKVAALKDAGYRLAIITNNVLEFSDAWRSLMPVDELFEHVIDSCVEGVRKPNSAIFELALERMGSPPLEQTLFLDDYPANVEAARALGITSILVDTDDARVIGEIDSHLPV